MTTMELYDKVQEVAQNKTPNNVMFGILQLSSLIDNALEDGLNANQINEVLRDSLNSCGKIYL